MSDETADSRPCKLPRRSNEAPNSRGKMKAQALEEMVRNFFEAADICEEHKGHLKESDAEYAERVKAGTEEDPEFVERYESCSREPLLGFMILMETYGNDQPVDALRQNCVWVLASDAEEAIEMLKQISENRDVRFVNSVDELFDEEITGGETTSGSDGMGVAAEGTEDETAAAAAAAAEGTGAETINGRDDNGVVDEERGTGPSTRRHQIVICTSFEQAMRMTKERLAMGADFAPPTTAASA